MRQTKVVAFIASLYPLAELMWRQYRQDLGAKPVEYITHSTGSWALNFLAITLAITPLRKLLGKPELIGFRRMMGLFAFFYAWMHLLTYLLLDKSFDFAEIVTDIGKRPFIWMGIASFLAMLPLALTSTSGWIGRLGGALWQRIHRLIYVAAIAGVVHYYWLSKTDFATPLIYAAIIGGLLLARLPIARRAANL